MEKELLELVERGVCMGLIPARGSSKSVPKKNIRMFKEHPLIAWSIAAAGLAGNINRVIVSTDSAEIAEISRHYGAEVSFLRPAEFAQDCSPDIDFVKHALRWLAEQEGKLPEYLAHVRVTVPVRNYRVVEEGVRRIRQDPEASSLRSGHICTHPPYKWLKYSESGYMEPLMPGMTCNEANMARQELPQIFIPNGYIDVLKTEFIIQNDLMHGDRMIGFETEEVLDIDTEEDLMKLEIYREHEEIVELSKYFDTQNK